MGIGEFVGAFLWIGISFNVAIFVGPMIVNKLWVGEEKEWNKFSVKNALQILATIPIMLAAVIVLCAVVQ